jgi:hypothetical protein
LLRWLIRCLLSTVDLGTPRAGGIDEPAHGPERPQETQSSSSPPANVVSVADPTPQSSTDPHDPSNSKEERSSVSKATLNHGDDADPPVSFMSYESLKQCLSMIVHSRKLIRINVMKVFTLTVVVNEVLTLDRRSRYTLRGRG